MLRRISRVRSMALGSTLLLGSACSGSSEGLEDPSPIEPDDVEEPDEEPDTASPPDIEAGCGNGIVESSEECDLGFANAADGTCTPACTLARCGDGFVAADEACDAGSPGDASCTDTCQVPSRLTWSRLISGSAHSWDAGEGLAPMPDGGVIMMSERRDDRTEFVLERYASDGALLWSHALPGDDPRIVGNAQLATTEDGQILTAHARRRFGADDSVPLLGVELMSLDEHGDISWVFEVPSTTEWETFGGRLAVLDSELLLAVNGLIEETSVSTRIIRLDRQGEMRSDREYEGYLSRVVAGPNDGFYASGGNDLMAFDADDQLRWSQTVAQTNVPALVVDSQWRVGVTYSDSLGARELRLFDSEGEPVWTAPIELRARAMTVGPGDVFVIGGRAEASEDDLATNTKLGVQLLDSDGRPLWSEGVDGPGNAEDYGRGVAVATDGAVWLCGRATVPYEREDIWIGRFDGGLR